MTSPRPRILIVTRNLPPLIGGMERLNWHIADELSRHADVRVIGPTGSAAQRPKGVALTEAPLRPLWRFLLASARFKELHLSNDEERASIMVGELPAIDNTTCRNLSKVDALAVSAALRRLRAI